MEYRVPQNRKPNLFHSLHYRCEKTMVFFQMSSLFQHWFSKACPRTKIMQTQHVCSACMEQSATRDLGLLLTFDIPEGDQVSPSSSVIWLTWRRLLQWSADVCIELCNSFISRFCKVPPQLCDGSTLIRDICSSSLHWISDICGLSLSATENQQLLERCLLAFQYIVNY